MSSSPAYNNMLMLCVCVCVDKLAMGYNSPQHVSDPLARNTDLSV